MVLGPGRAAGKGHLASHPVSTPLATWLQVVCACFPQTESLDTEPARVPDPSGGMRGEWSPMRFAPSSQRSGGGWSGLGS